MIVLTDQQAVASQFPLRGNRRSSSPHLYSAERNLRSLRRRRRISLDIPRKSPNPLSV